MQHASTWTELYLANSIFSLFIHCAESGHKLWSSDPPLFTWFGELVVWILVVAISSERFIDSRIFVFLLIQHASKAPMCIRSLEKIDNIDHST